MLTTEGKSWKALPWNQNDKHYVFINFFPFIFSILMKPCIKTGTPPFI